MCRMHEWSHPIPAHSSGSISRQRGERGERREGREGRERGREEGRERGREAGEGEGREGGGRKRVRREGGER